ncbi:MAG: hypothetical protein Q8911_00370 [Bacillota bacterium]|nr:hypothetical protein [Bacillota bacterium]
MEVEIIFKDASKPKKIENVSDIYTKGEMICVRVGDFIFKYPLMNIFSICHKHGFHWGSKAHQSELGGKQ